MRKDFHAYLVGEILLVGLLGASLALFLAYPGLHTAWDLPRLRLVLQTISALVGGLVALLAGVRFSVEGRRVDLLLSSGFLVWSLSAALFAVGPTLGGARLGASEAWTALLGSLVGQGLVAAAPLVRGRSGSRDWAVANALWFAGIGLFGAWAILRAVHASLPPVDPEATSLQALVDLVAVVGFGERFRRRGDDLDRWLALGATLFLFASLHTVLMPVRGANVVSQADFLRLLAFAVLLVGAWRAIRFAEFGRAVAEERARVAREIHDGLAQYLFAVSTHASMLDAGAPPEETLPRLKQAASLAQQEARFAVLALSSASGTAPFDAALTRYIEFLAADGELEVELEIDPGIRLAPDEQIEIFRIVQEGLANVRKHACATHAEVTIGQRAGTRFVEIRDDGEGFDGEDAPAGQGLRNMRARATSIDGAFTLRSAPGRGTALEVVLRPS